MKPKPTAQDIVVHENPVPVISSSVACHECRYWSALVAPSAHISGYGRVIGWCARNGVATSAERTCSVVVKTVS